MTLEPTDFSVLINLIRIIQITDISDIIDIITIIRIVVCFQCRHECAFEGLGSSVSRTVAADAENRSKTLAYQRVSGDTTKAPLSTPGGLIMTKLKR
jgi:hypothetical protein